MKKTKKRIAVFLSVVILLSVLAVRFYAETVYEHDGVLYTKMDNDFVSVYGYKGEASDLVIPDSVDEGYVFSVGAFALQNNTSITTLDLSKAAHLNMLGMMCFNGCSALTGDLYIPFLVTDVRMGAFQGCSSLTSVDFAARTNLIPEACFNRCTSLSKVTISPSVTSIGKLAFANCTDLNEVYIPNSVTDIHFTAFDNDDSLVVYCYSDSYARQFAIANGISYVLLDAPAPTEPPTEEPTVAPTEEPTTAPTEAPTLEPTELPTEAVVPILGDADGNGVIEVDDATYIQRVIAELPVPYPMETIMYGDVDGDDELTITDATLIQRYVAEMPVNYPIGEPNA